MGLKLERKKQRHTLLSILYRLNKIRLFGSKRRFKLLLDLEWIFNRLAHEESFRFYTKNNHPVRIHSAKFILEELNSGDTILDLGCKYGELTSLIAANGNKIIGIDNNRSSIIKAKELNTFNNIEYINEDANDFIKDNKSNCNILILSHILEHIDNPEYFLKTIVEKFEKVFIEVPDFDSTYLNTYRKDQNVNLNYTDTDHVSEFSREELMQLINNSNLTIVKSDFKFGVQKFWCIKRN